MNIDHVKHNWTETALNIWRSKYSRNGKITGDNRRITAGIISLILSDEATLRQDSNWFSLSHVKKADFFSDDTETALNAKLEISISKAAYSKKTALQCIKEAYQQGFSLDGKTNFQQAQTECQVPDDLENQDQNLKEIWTKVTFTTLKTKQKSATVRYLKEDHVRNKAEEIFGKLTELFGDVNYKRFVTDDDVMDALDNIMDNELSEAKEDYNKKMIKAMQEALSYMPRPV